MNRHATLLAACVVTGLLAANPAISLAIAMTRYPG
jgi:hypothetical protein